MPWDSRATAFKPVVVGVIDRRRNVKEPPELPRSQACDTHVSKSLSRLIHDASMNIGAARTLSQSWLLLIHQLPAKPAYLRVKIWRRLQGIGAIAVKNAVHALPMSDGTQEDFEWLLREIVEGGGEAFLCETRLIDGLSDDEVRKLFDQARDADYEEIARDARTVTKSLRPKLKREAVNERRAQAARLRKRLGEAAEIDFFGAIGREAAERSLKELEARLTENDPVVTKENVNPKSNALAALRNRTWVTRQGVHIDRI